MRILICGAADLQDEIFPAFDRVVEGMGFESEHFNDLLHGADNFDTWVQNSVRAVKSAQIVVFALKEKSGEITWQHEYVSAINEGKPMVILVRKKLAEKYFDGYKNGEIKNVKKHPQYAAFKTLDILLAQERSVLTFGNIDEFKENLKKALLNEFEKSFAALQDFNKRKSLVENIKRKNYSAFLKTEHGQLEKQYLTEILLDNFEDKEIRKRVLEYFKISKILTDESIISLFEDSEQGVARAAVESLPELVGPQNDKSKILDHLIKVIENNEDTGIIRRSISSIYKIDPALAVKRLISLFPSHDIGTSKRIIRWLLENRNEIDSRLKNSQFLDDLNKLANSATHSTTKAETLKDMIKELKAYIIKVTPK